MLKVTAAILIYQGKILIAKRSEADKLANKWEFPGGKIESGETPQECLYRELQEELGIETVIGDFFGESIYDAGDKIIHLLAYWTKWQAGKIKAQVHAEVKWVKLADLYDFDFAPADIPLVDKLLQELK